MAATDAADISDHVPPTKREVEDGQLTSKLSDTTLNNVPIEEKKESRLSQSPETIKILEMAENVQVRNNIEGVDVNIVNKGNAEAVAGENFLQSPSVANGKPYGSLEENQISTKEELRGSQEEEKGGVIITNKSIIAEASGLQNEGTTIQTTDSADGSSMDIENLGDICNIEEKMASVSSTETISITQDSREPSFERGENKSKTSSSTAGEMEDKTKQLTEAEVDKKEMGEEMLRYDDKDVCTSKETANPDNQIQEEVTESSKDVRDKLGRSSVIALTEDTAGYLEEEDSSAKFEEGIRGITELSNKMKDLTSSEDESQINNLGSSLVEKVEDKCFQKVDNLETVKESYEVGLKDIVEEIQSKADSQTEILANIASADVSSRQTEESTRKEDVYLSATEALIVECNHEGVMAVSGEDYIVPEEKDQTERHWEQSFIQETRQSKENLESPFGVASVEIETTAFNEEPIADIVEQRPVGRPEEIFEETRKDELTVSDDIKQTAIPEEKIISKVQMDDKHMHAEVEIPNKNVKDFHATHQETAQVGGENGDQVQEAFEVPKEVGKHANETCEESRTSESTISEHTSIEGSVNIDKLERGSGLKSKEDFKEINSEHNIKEVIEQKGKAADKEVQIATESENTEKRAIEEDVLVMNSTPLCIGGEEDQPDEEDQNRMNIYEEAASEFTALTVTEETSSTNNGKEAVRNLEEKSSMASEEGIRETSKLGERMSLESSLTDEVEDRYFQKVDSLETFKQEHETGLKDVVKESPKKEDNQNEILENIASTDSSLWKTGSVIEYPEPIVHVSSRDPAESTRKESNDLTPTEALTMESTLEGIVAGEDNNITSEEDHTETSEHKEHSEQNFTHRVEPTMENLESPLDVASQKIETPVPKSSEYDETVTNIEETGIIGTPEDIFVEIKDKVIISDILQEKDLSKVDLDEKIKSAEVEIAHSPTDEVAQERGEKNDEVSASESGNQAYEALEVPKLEEKHMNQTYEASESPESTILEQTSSGGVVKKDKLEKGCESSSEEEIKEINTSNIIEEVMMEHEENPADKEFQKETEGDNNEKSPTEEDVPIAKSSSLFTGEEADQHGQEDTNRPEKTASELDSGNQICRMFNGTKTVNDIEETIQEYKDHKTAEKREESEKEMKSEVKSTFQDTTKYSKENEVEANKCIAEQTGEELETISDDDGIRKQVPEEGNRGLDLSMVSPEKELEAESSKDDALMTTKSREEVNETTKGSQLTQEQIVNNIVSIQSAEFLNEKTTLKGSQKDEGTNDSEEYETAKTSTTMEESPIADLPSPSFGDKTVEESLKEEIKGAMRPEEEVWNANTESKQQTSGATYATEEREVKALRDVAELIEDKNAHSTTGSSEEQITPSESNLDHVEISSPVPEIYEKGNKEESAEKADFPEETRLLEAEAQSIGSSNMASTDKDLVTTETNGSNSIDIIAKPAETSSLGENKDQEIPTARKNGTDEVDKDTLSKTDDQREIANTETSSDDKSEQNLQVSSLEMNNLMKVELSQKTDDDQEKDKTLPGKTEIPLLAETKEENLMETEDESTNTKNTDSSDIERSANDDVQHGDQELHTTIKLNNEKSISESSAEILQRFNTGEVDNCNENCKLETSEDEKLSDIGSQKNKSDSEISVTEASKVFEECDRGTDTGKATPEQEESVKNTEDVSKESVKSENAPVKFDAQGSEISEAKSVSTLTEKKSESLEEVAEEKSYRSFQATVDQTSNEEECYDDENQTTDLIKEQRTGQDIRGSKQIRNKDMEMEPELETQKETNKALNAIMTEEVPRELERLDDSEIIKEQTIEEESCTRKLPLISDVDETVNKVAELDLTPIQSLEATSSTNDTEVGESKVADDLNQEIEASPITQALKEETMNTIKLPVAVSSSVSEVSEKTIHKENKEDAENWDSKTDFALPKVSEATTLGEVKLNDEPVKALDYTVEAKTSEATDASTQEAENDSTKLEEQSCMVSNLRKDKHEETDDGSILEKADADDAEPEEAKTPHPVSKSKDQGTEDIQEAVASLTVGDTITKEMELQAKEVPEAVFEPMYQRVEAAGGDELISPTVVIAATGLEEVHPNDKLIKAHNTSSDIGKEADASLQDAEVDTRKLEETSSKVSHTPIHEPEEANEGSISVEKSDAVEETRTPHTVSEAKHQGVETIGETGTNLPVGGYDTNEIENESVKDLGSVADAKTPEATDASLQEAENENTKLEEKSSNVTHRPIDEHEEADNESILEKADTNDVEFEEVKIPQAVLESKDQGVAEIQETHPSLKVVDSDTNEIDIQARDVPEALLEPLYQGAKGAGRDKPTGLTVVTGVTSLENKVHETKTPGTASETKAQGVEEIDEADTNLIVGGPGSNETQKEIEEVPEALPEPTNQVDETTGHGEIAPGQSLYAAKIEEQFLVSPFASLSNDEDSETTAKIGNTEDGISKKDDTEADNLKPEEVSGMVECARANNEAVENPDAVEIEDESVKDLDSAADAKTPGATDSILQEAEDGNMKLEEKSSNVSHCPIDEHEEAANGSILEKVDANDVEPEDVKTPQGVLESKDLCVGEIQEILASQKVGDTGTNPPVGGTDTNEIEDESVKDLDSVADAKTPEATDASLQEAEIDNTELEEKSSNVSHRPTDEHEEADNESILDKADANDVELEEVKTPRAVLESKDQGVEKIQETLASLKVGDTDTNEIEIQARDVPEALPEPLYQGAEAAGRDEATVLTVVPGLTSLENKVQETKSPGTASETKDQGVEEIHEAGRNLTVGGTGTNETQKEIEEVLEALPEPTNQGDETAAHNKIAPGQTLYAAKIEEQSLVSPSAFPSNKEDSETTSKIGNTEDGISKKDDTEADNLKPEEVSGMVECERANIDEHEEADKESILEKADANDVEPVKTPQGVLESKDQGVEEIQKTLASQKVGDTGTNIPVGGTDTKKIEDESVKDLDSVANAKTPKVTDASLQEAEIDNTKLEEKSSIVSNHPIDEHEEAGIGSILDKADANDIELEEVKTPQAVLESKDQGVGEIQETLVGLKVGDTYTNEIEIQAREVPEALLEPLYQGAKAAGRDEPTVLTVVTGVTSLENKVQETKSPGTASETKDQGIEEIHEAGTNLAVEGTGRNETQEEIEEVPEAVPEPTNQGDETAVHDEIAPGQTLYDEKLVSPSAFLSNKEDSETAAKIGNTEDGISRKDDTKADNLKPEEASGMAKCQRANNEAVENQDADEVKLDETKTLDDASDPKDQSFEEIFDTTRSLPEERNDTDKMEENIKEEPDPRYQSAEAADDKTPDQLEPGITTEKTEDKSIKKVEPGVDKIKLEETITRFPNADNPSATKEKSGKHHVGDEEAKVSEAISESNVYGGEEISEIRPSPIMEKAHTEGVREDINAVPEILLGSYDQVAEEITDGDATPYQTVPTERKEQLQETSTALLKELHHETINEVEIMKDESTKKGETRLNEDIIDSFGTGVSEKRYLQDEGPRKLELSNVEMAEQDTQNRVPKEEFLAPEEASTLKPQECTPEMKYPDSPMKNEKSPVQCGSQDTSKDERTMNSGKSNEDSENLAPHLTSKEILPEEVSEKCEDAPILEFEKTGKVFEGTETKDKGAITEPRDGENHDEEITEADEGMNKETSSEKIEITGEKEVSRNSDPTSPHEETVTKSTQEVKLLAEDYPGEGTNETFETRSTETQHGELLEESEKTSAYKNVREMTAAEDKTALNPYQGSLMDGTVKFNPPIEEVIDGKNVKEAPVELDLENQVDGANFRGTALATEKMAPIEEVKSSKVMKLEEDEEERTGGDDNDETAMSMDEQLQSTDQPYPPVAETISAEEVPPPEENVGEEIKRVTEPALEIERYEEKKEIASAESNNSVSESHFDNEKVEQTLELAASEGHGTVTEEGLNLEDQEEVPANKPSISSCTAISQEKIADKESETTVDEKQHHDVMSDKEPTRRSVSTSKKGDSIQCEEDHTEVKETTVQPSPVLVNENERKLDDEPITQTTILTAIEDDDETQQHQIQIGKPNVVSHVKDAEVVLHEKGILNLDQVVHEVMDGPVQELEKTTLPISRETIERKADPRKSTETTISTAKKDVRLIQEDPSAKSFQNARHVSGTEPEAKGIEHGEEEEEEKGKECQQTTEKPIAIDSAKLPLSDILHRSTKETSQVVEHLNEKREWMGRNEELQTETAAETTRVEESKTEKEEEEDEHKKTDSGSDAPVMVEASGDMNGKVAHKKSHNIFSGVGSKVKHSIAKVKKAITGKHSHARKDNIARIGQENS